MMTTVGARLPGEETLLASWAALMPGSPGSRAIRTRTSDGVVFPNWSPLNNAILRDAPTEDAATRAAAELAEVYRSAGVTAWALWLPSAALDLDAPDQVGAIDGMVRDTTTLVMTRELPSPTSSHPGVVRTTAQAANLAGEEPVRVDALPDADSAGGVEGWVLAVGGWAVTGAWTFHAGEDVGVYAVGTAPAWRRRGLARALMLHVLTDAYRRGARTASLQATRMGHPLYEVLGFRPVGRYEEWVPQAAHGADVSEDDHDDAR